MNFDLSEDQIVFQNLAKEFAAKELAPFAAKWDSESYFPKEVIEKAVCETLYVAFISDLHKLLH